MKPNRPRMLVAVLALISSLLPLHAGPAGAQEAADGGKVPLTHDVYDSWKSIRGEVLSADGNWLLYAEVPQDGDAELVVRSLDGESEYRAGLGHLTAGNAFFPRVTAEFTADSTHVVFLASPDKAAIEAAEEEGKKGDAGPKKALGILDLSDGSVVTVERVKSFELPEEAGGWVAYLLEKPLEEEDGGEGEDSGEAGEEGQPEEPAPTEPEPGEPEPGEPQEPGEPEQDEEEEDKDKDYGTELVVRSLRGGDQTSIASVMDARFTDDASRLLYIVSSEEAPGTDGVYALELDSGSAGTTRRWSTLALLTGEGNYRHLTLNEDETRFAFVTDRSDYEADEPVFELYGGAVDADSATLWVSHASTAGFPEGMAVSDKEGLTFSGDGAVVMFGIKERPEPEEDGSGEDGAGGTPAGERGEAEDGEEDEERAEFDLWHWDDPYPQPRQLQMADEVRNEAYESVWWIDEGRFVQLADEDLLPDVQLSEDGSLALGISDDRWEKAQSYEGFYNDIFIVDTTTGERTLIAPRVSWGASMAPDGSAVAWFGGDGEWVGYDVNGQGGFEGGQDWFLYDVASGETRNLSEGLEAAFERHDWDTPNLPAPYGAAGFTEDGSALLVYDRYDVWSFPVDGGEPRRITEGVGREMRTSFRWRRIDPDVDGVPVERPVLLASTNEETMATGFWADRVTGQERPVELYGADAGLSFQDRADDADTVLFSRQTFSEYPDLWVASLELGGEAGEPTMRGIRKVTDLGAQTDPYVWGEAELRDFRSADGLPLKGILIKPENFDPDEKYPLMVYIYETLHPGLHRFRHPSPGTSINPSYYVSNGYVVWMPDIEYVTPGMPGKDALKCVLPGINMLLDEGYIDPDAVGIQGHSWGGYQIAYMVTQTDVFTAAEAGAPVSNMTSAYGGIRWGSGLVRQFQYERTQSRLGASLWEVPLRFVENSPLFWADDIDTPLLILHNDEDGAVPWYQGIELIMALRRLGKESYMFNYNGEAHGLRQRVNQEDWTVRMQEFFDHHLRGAPAPEWMTEGIRGWEKGEVDR